MTYRIEEARKARGWSQQQLADAAGTTQQAIQRYEAGDREPKGSAIVRMSAALNVTISYLLGLDEEPEGAEPQHQTPEERELVSIFRSTDARGRETIMAVARAQRRGDSVPATNQVMEAV